MWVNFRKLNAHIRQLHSKHAGFCIRHFLHFVSSFSIDDFFCPQLFHPWAPLLLENCIPLFSSPSPQSPPLPPFSFNLFFAQHLQFEICVIATSKLENEQIIAVDFVTEVKPACPGHLKISWETLTILKGL